MGERGEGIQRLSSLGILCIHWRRGGLPYNVTQSRSEMQHIFTMLVFLLHKKRRELQGEANEKSTFHLGLWTGKNTSHPFHLFSLTRKGKILFFPFQQKNSSFPIWWPSLQWLLLIAVRFGQTAGRLAGYKVSDENQSKSKREKRQIGVGWEHNLFRQHRCSRRECVSAALPSCGESD